MEGDNKDDYNIVNNAAHSIKYLWNYLKKYLAGIRYNLDDILYIIRPFIYVYSVMKFGKKSYQPLKIALVIDLVSIVLSIIRLNKQ